MRLLATGEAGELVEAGPCLLQVTEEAGEPVKRPVSRGWCTCGEAASKESP
jgi:hypothetical protein